MDFVVVSVAQAAAASVAVSAEVTLVAELLAETSAKICTPTITVPTKEPLWVAMQVVNTALAMVPVSMPSPVSRSWFAT